MLAPSLDAVRLSLHVLAATVWVGGQFVMVGLLPTARTLGPDAPTALARSFGRLSWPAYAVLVLTGFWNIAATHPSDQTAAWRAVLVAKIVVVALAGLGVLLHTRATTKAGRALWGAVGALASVAALVLGILLAG
jgi:putative copper export protein